MLPKINPSKLECLINSQNSNPQVVRLGYPVSERVESGGARIIEAGLLYHLQRSLEVELCVHRVLTPIRIDDPSSQEIVVIGSNHDGLNVSFRMRRDERDCSPNFSSDIIAIRLPFGNAIEGVVPMMRIA